MIDISDLAQQLCDIRALNVFKTSLIFLSYSKKNIAFTNIMALQRCFKVKKRVRELSLYTSLWLHMEIFPRRLLFIAYWLELGHMATTNPIPSKEKLNQCEYL